MNEEPNTIHTDEDDEDNTFCDRSFHRLFGRVATEKFLEGYFIDSRTAYHTHPCIPLNRILKPNAYP
jgi:hypothetical protein